MKKLMLLFAICLATIGCGEQRRGKDKQRQPGLHVGPTFEMRPWYDIGSGKIGFGPTLRLGPRIRF